MGSVIKKITRPIKKIAKSPIGKAALAAAAIRFGGPAIFGASESTNPLIIALKKGQIGGTIAALPAPNSLNPPPMTAEVKRLLGSNPLPLNPDMIPLVIPDRKAPAANGLRPAPIPLIKDN